MTNIFYEDIQRTAIDLVRLMPGIPIDALIRDLQGPNPDALVARDAIWDLVEQKRLRVLRTSHTNGVYLPEDINA